MIPIMTVVGIDVSRNWLDGFCLPDERRFRRANTATGVPTPRQACQHRDRSRRPHRPHRVIARSGRGWVRGDRRTGVAALTAIRHNPNLKTVTHRLREKGKPHKVIMVAIARRLMVKANAILKNAVPWTLQDTA